MATVTVAVVALTGCGSGSHQPPAQAAAPTSTTALADPIGYARALLDVRHQYLNDTFSAQSTAKAAEVLNGITPPSAFQLRHKLLIDEVVAVSKMPHDVRAGAAEGRAESDLITLAHEADPNSGY